MESLLDWLNGQIVTNNPDDAIIDKMIKIAGELGAEVQGDDGEICEELAGDHTGAYQPQRPEQTFVQKLAVWFRGTFRESGSEIIHASVPFGVGDRVVDSWGRNHTVISIDPNAEKGLGAIRIKSEDGMEIVLTVVVHGLNPFVEE